MASIVINGDTSGSVTLQAPATAGATVLTLPSTSGTVVTTATSSGISGSAITTGTVSVSVGGTGQTTAAAAYNALNPMTTTGDIIYEASPSTAARLPIGTTGQVLTVSGGIPSWGTITAFVSGMIILWSGSSGSIPSGWLLCDGTNSTPDLRNRFVVGATSTYAVGATGGSANAVVVSHTHTATVTDPGHFHSTGNPDTGGGSYFGVIAATGGNAVNRDGLVGGLVNSNTYQTNTKTTGITVSNNTQGVSGTNANLPPYYALCYIMKS